MTVTIAIAGVSGGVVPFESLTIEEALDGPGPSPASAWFEVVDLASAVSIADLADVVIADGAETLFRGQVVNVEDWPDGSYRRFRVSCSDYNRLVSGMTVYPGGVDAYEELSADTYQSLLRRRLSGQDVDDDLIALWATVFPTQSPAIWIGDMTGYVFRQMVSRWWVDPPTRTGLAASVTRNTATLAADCPYVEAWHSGTCEITDADDIGLTEPYWAWLVTGTTVDRVRVTGGFGTTTLTFEPEDPARGTARHPAGSTLYGPMTDYVTHVEEGAKLPRGGMTWLDLPLDTVLSDLCTLTAPGVTWWLDGDFAWHFATFPSGQAGYWTATTEETLARRLPRLVVDPTYVATSGFSDAPDGVNTFPTYQIMRRRDMSTVARGAWVRGLTASGSGWVDNPDAPALGPVIVLEAPSTGADTVETWARAELAMRTAGTSTVTFYTLGGTGWHRGQVVAVTNAALGLAGTQMLVRSLRLTLASADSVRRYDFELGDVRGPLLSRSLSGTRLTGRRPRSVEYAPDAVSVEKLKLPASKWTIATAWDHMPPPGRNELLFAQLTTQTGEPMHVANIACAWTLSKNGVDIGLGSVADGVTLSHRTTLTDTLGQTVNMIAVDPSATPGDEYVVNVESA